MRRLSLLAPVAVSVLALAPSCNLLFAFAPDQLCESQIRAICHFAYACCNATERDAFIGTSGFRNEGDCVEQLLAEQGSCGNALAVHEATQQGRFEYDSALAERCEKPLMDAANSCNADAVLGDALKEAEECEGKGGGNFAYGQGKVENGDPCFASFECAEPGSICEPAEDPDGDGEILVTRVGTCKAPAKEGEDCSADGSDGLCEPGTFCDFATEECTAFQLLGNGEACFDDDECESGFCDDIDFTVQATCSDRLADGEACFEDDDCANGLCDDNANGEFVCTARDDVVVEACNGLQGDDTQFE